MDTLIGLLVLAAAVAVFVGMVRRTNTKGRELERQTNSKPWLTNRPTLLTKQQRKTLNSSEQKKTQISNSPEAVQLEPRPAKKITRAIRTGWSMGKVEFRYKDAKGEITNRTVTVHAITRTYLKGECHSRQAERTFRIARIIGDLTDCETGEIISPEKWVEENAL
ncbi:WYL domain-containing protein [Pseudomonas sp. BJa5]|uniref:WYL domain-containing protein n=1 Tax=Pseudomonas sp. BJa5 TaxID=2936270 RepID=UPI002559778A|nr:WYL domain-containing protein [Pseudomonas sp. BGr12]MDL2419628.1 hypothetical protein [Pseudomonas sp. BGr12]